MACPNGPLLGGPAAGAEWVTHMDVDEFLVPPPSLNAEQYLMELLTPFGERRLPPRALALPCVFFASLLLLFVAVAAIVVP